LRSSTVVPSASLTLRVSKPATRTLVPQSCGVPLAEKAFIWMAVP
jgi:hypothetical protein